MIEHWIIISHCPRYSVSNLGRVYDIFRDRLVTQTPDKVGYLRVKIRFPDGFRMTVSVHRLVAGAFYEADIKNFEVNHIDGDKQNNHISNLELCNRSENMIHAFAMGLANPVAPVLRVRIVETGEIFNSTAQVDRHLKVSPGSVAATLKGYQRTCRGYTFEIVE